MSSSYLTAEEAATMLHVGKSTLYSYVKQGIVKPIKVGRKFLFHPDELDRQLKDNSSEAIAHKTDILEKFKVRMADKKIQVSPDLMVAVETLIEIVVSNQNQSA